MANIAAANITSTFLTRRRNNGRSYFNVQLQFGNGALTYPAGGVPVTAATFGLTTVIESCDIYDDNLSGYQWKYNATNGTLTANAVGGHGHSLFLKDAAQTDAAGNRVNAAASNKLGANTGTSITVVASDGATNGGVVSAPASTALGEVAGVAIAAQTLKCEVIGW